MELKITKEKVLDAASKCSTAKATLEVLFPEAFVADSKSVDLRSLVGKELDRQNSGIIWVSWIDNKQFDGISFGLNSKYNWEIIKDNEGVLRLVPTNKI